MARRTPPPAPPPRRPSWRPDDFRPPSFGIPARYSFQATLYDWADPLARQCLTNAGIAWEELPPPPYDAAQPRRARAPRTKVYWPIDGRVSWEHDFTSLGQEKHTATLHDTGVALDHFSNRHYTNLITPSQTRAAMTAR